MASIDIIVQRQNAAGRLVWVRLPSIDADTGKPTNAPKGARYRARWRTPDGESRTKTFDRKLAAEEHLANVTVDKSRNAYVDPRAGRTTFADYAERWAEVQDWKESTRESFGPHLRRVLPHIGKLRLDQVDELALKRLRKALADAYANSTATISLHYACSIMRSAHRSRRIAFDPTTNVDPPKRRDGAEDGVVGPDQVPTRDDVVALIAAAPERYRAAVALGACGLRVGEVMGAADVGYDLETGELKVDRQLQRRGGEFVITLPKRDKTRTIKLAGWARLEIRRHLRDHGPFTPLPGTEGGLLFRGGRGAPMRRDQFYEVVWYPALRAAGLARETVDSDGEPAEIFPFTFHSLRHWCASSLLAEGAPITAVAGYLGDTVETVSRTYAHWLRDDRDVPAAVLDRLLAAASKGSAGAV